MVDARVASGGGSFGSSAFKLGDLAREPRANQKPIPYG